MDTNIHSIWVEDEQTSKFHLNDPNLQIINSDKPLLSSKKHIDLPPLPPSSFFSSLHNEEQADSKTKKNFIKAFKKFLSDDSSPSKQPKKQIRRKISTPFGFNHISHIDNKSDNITVSQLHELAPIDQEISENKVEITRDPSRRVSTSAKAFCTSPQVVSPMKSSTTKPIPRSFSNATSLNTRASSSQLFTRSGSISTMATSISSKTHSRKPSVVNQPQQLQSHQEQTTTHSYNKINHQHQDSSSSIENLKKLEKNQIQKQTSNDYSSSSFKFPNNNNNSMNWGTPDPQSVSRQSWIYEEPPISPSSKYSNSKTSSPRSLKTSKSSPYNLNNFSSHLDNSFIPQHDMNEIIQSMDDFTKFFKSSEHPDELDEDNLNETIASIKAAKHIRASRLSIHQDPKYLSFIEEFEKIKTNSTQSNSSSNSNLLSNADLNSQRDSTPSSTGRSEFKELEDELEQEEQKFISNSLEIDQINEVEESSDFDLDESIAESVQESESKDDESNGLLPSVM